MSEHLEVSTTLGGAPFFVVVDELGYQRDADPRDPIIRNACADTTLEQLERKISEMAQPGQPDLRRAVAARVAEVLGRTPSQIKEIDNGTGS